MLFIIWQIGEDVFDIDNIISILLGFVAIFLTLFFVNRDRTRKIKTEYFTVYHLGFVLRNMAISLREIKVEIDKTKEKCDDDDTVKINNRLNKLLHHIRYLHHQDQLMSVIGILDIYDKIPELMYAALDNMHKAYSNERITSDMMKLVYEASEQIRIIAISDWCTRYDKWRWAGIAHLIITDDIYGGKSYNELMSSVKQSRYGNDANRATPI